jgi:hypothetical protein
MLCAVAQSIRSPRAALLVDDDDDDRTARLLILRVVVVNDNDNATLSDMFYLLQTTQSSVGTANICTATQLAFRRKWVGRPFPYCSAIN